MKKIPCLFKKNYSKRERPIVDEILKGSEWVVEGEGRATKKFDGTCCLIKNGHFYKRYTYKSKKLKQPPEDFIPATEIDKITGKQEGWRSVRNSDKYHMEAINKESTLRISSISIIFKDGTYELCGPKIQRNPERFKKHILVKHGCQILINAPRTFNDLKKYFQDNNIEGIVWHHKDGRMVKIKGIDFGIKRK